MFTPSKTETREQVIDWLSTQPTAYHLTFSFPALTNHHETKKLLDLLITHLNRRIYKGRYEKGLNYIEGIVIREETNSLGTDHYHIMIIDRSNSLPAFNRFNEIIEHQRHLFHGHSKKNHIKKFTLQEYYNDDDTNGLEIYLTKNFSAKSYSWLKAVDSIGVLTDNKIIFGRDFF